MRKRLRRHIGARAFAAFLLFYGGLLLPFNAPLAAGRIVPIDIGSEAVQSMKLPPSLANLKSSTIVSAAQIDETYVAFADYTNLSCFRVADASIKLVPRPVGLKGEWVPTGIAYNPQTRLLYVANYTGNNVLEGTLDCEKGEFILKFTISSSDMVSPETVAIADDGMTLVAAQYDSGNVLAFTHGSAGWRSQWAAKVPVAHGVAIIGERVYVNSLGQDSINSFDLHTGKLIKTAGQFGTNPVKTDLMWPTGLDNFNGTLVLADAHTGFICSINQETLQAETCFGGQGDGPRRFNMPYDVARLGKNLLVLSTFSSRVAEAQVDFAAGTVRIVRDWYWTGNETLNSEFTKPLDYDPLRTVAFGNNPYSTVCLMPTWLPGMTCGYAGVVNRDEAQFLRFPTFASILDPEGMYYFIDSFHGGSAEDVYFYSPQLAAILNLRLKGEVPYMLMRSYESDMQRRGNYLVTANKSISTDTIRSDFDTLLAALEAARNRDGVVPSDAAARLLARQPQYFQSRLKTSIAGANSPAGTKFLADYLGCSGDSCAGQTLRKDALNFAEEQLRSRDVLLDRVILPCMLTNAPCRSLIWNYLVTKPGWRGRLQRILMSSN